MFERLRADLNRFIIPEFLYRNFIRGCVSQGFQAILVYRFFHWLKKKQIPSQPFRFIIERFVEITTGISIPAECCIGKGLRIHHFGGIVFHPSVKIGKNATIYHNVTIGDLGGTGNAAVIGDNVLIGAGAKIIGPITIGSNCKIGANSVVSFDIPSCSTVYMNSCVVKKKYKEMEDL